MKLTEIKLKNFRSYADEVAIEINDMNVFVGKNDIGKSTILEAMDIFFNEGKGSVKLDKDDINRTEALSGNQDIIISVKFSDLPSEVILDETNPTTLASEYLLNAEGQLEIIKIFPNAGKEKVFVRAYHPANAACADLLTKKNSELKRLLPEGVPCADRTKNAELRKAIWNHYSGDLQQSILDIELAKIEGKNTWDRLKCYLPLFVLFQSDRKNSDKDDEIQDPMKLAVREILRKPEISSQLQSIAEKVQEKLQVVADSTLNKLREMNPDIADTLNPVMPSSDSLSWADVFKNVSIAGDEDIPLNKRGSGVKRLVLLNFFRAEAERRQIENNIQNIIYAIEEPETSQHLDHQRKLINAFIRLSEAPTVQVVLTTHSPSIVKMLNFEHLRIIYNGSQRIQNIAQSNLPYPSLLEVNYAAFGESDEEYHNELYAYIESENAIPQFSHGKSTRAYVRLLRDGNTRTEQKILSEYIRHKIHHPENPHNSDYTNLELQQSIHEMRSFIGSLSSSQSHADIATHP